MRSLLSKYLYESISCVSENILFDKVGIIIRTNTAAVNKLLLLLTFRSFIKNFVAEKITEGIRQRKYLGDALFKNIRAYWAILAAPSETVANE